ncbi:MAG: tRNA (adenosine(37)-N6)-dimethylallyltransferase MiaA [Candidatus Omnitrophota bacterium]|nr:tRNA (adenosine(37)-N6)-dimethylallyltransferase MiaA [Candidatus Omnitrophota bacterium]
MIKKKIFFLIGPTAIGKSEIAISLAKKIKAEIISCDSMQVYRTMDIITSKATPAQRRAVKHHLQDIIEPAREYNVSKYRKQAISVCNKLFKKGKVPLFVGGTGLYYSIIIDGLFPAAPRDKKIRAKLYKQLTLKGSGWLHKRLAGVDHEASVKIHANDARRIIRALEVFMKTSKPISSLQKQRIGLGPEYEIKIFGLTTSRQALYKKINQRVEKMFSSGLIDEVKQLLKHKLSRTAACAIGVVELKDYFNGVHSLAQAKSLIQLASRHYAKRQLTWFRKDKRIQWIKVKAAEKPKAVAQRIWKKLS